MVFVCVCVCVCVYVYLCMRACVCLCVCLCLCLCVSDLLACEEAERLNDVKFLVQQLYTTLRIEEHQLGKERELIGRLEDLNTQLRPLEKVRPRPLHHDWQTRFVVKPDFSCELKTSSGHDVSERRPHGWR